MSTGYYLIVDQELENIKTFQKYHWGFYEQKELNQLFTAAFKSASVRAGFDKFVVDCRAEAKNLMVVHFENFKGDTFEFASLQKHFTELKESQSFLEFRSNQICSLTPFVDISLRSLVIRKYFFDHIAPKINPTVAEYTANRGGFHIKTSFGFLSGFRKKILIDYAEATSIHWARMLYNQETLSIIENNLSIRKGIKIYQGFPTDETRYIDIFTNDSTDAHLINLLMGNGNHLAYCVDLKPLVDRLKEFELLTAI